MPLTRDTLLSLTGVTDSVQRARNRAMIQQMMAELLEGEGELAPEEVSDADIAASSSYTQMASGVVSTQKRQGNFWEEQLSSLEKEKNKELKGYSEVPIW